MTQMYYWCQLRRGNRYTCGYIEERGASIGNKVELVDLDGKFWEVTSVGQPGVTKEFVRKSERGYKDFQGSTRGDGIDEKSTV